MTNSTNVEVRDDGKIEVRTVTGRIEFRESGPPGPRGDTGPAGPGGGVTDLSLVAGVALSGLRAVIAHSDLTLVYADSSTAAHAVAYIWLTTGAVAMGSLASVISGGEVTDPSWSWTPGLPIFLGINGVLTQTPPTSPSVFSRQVAFALTANIMIFDVQPSIALTP